MNESKMNSPLSFLESLEKLFYTDMDQQTSACIFGSSLTDDWVVGRSDLDLFIIVPETKLELVGEKIKVWHSNPINPLLDGFVLYSSAYGIMVRELHKFEKARKLGNFIPLIDLWNVKNRSKHLFGEDVTRFVQEISQEDLKVWALNDIEKYWIPLFSDLISRSDISSEAKIPQSMLIWTASGVARMLMLTKGNICSSKREALKWLADQNIAIREIINKLSLEFEKPDDIADTFTTDQTVTLGKYYLQLFRVAKSESQKQL